MSLQNTFQILVVQVEYSLLPAYLVSRDVSRVRLNTVQCVLGLYKLVLSFSLYAGTLMHLQGDEQG